MKKSLSFLTKLAIAIAIVIVISVSSATTAKAWEVTITNDTAYTCSVSLMISHFFWASQFGDSITLQPGQSYTWKTEGWCPAFFEGGISGPQGWRNIASADCLGNKGGSSSFTCCWNLKFKICKKISGDHVEVRDNDYGFCKQ